MSIKMFFMSSFGLIPSTTKTEENYQQRLAAYNELTAVEQSQELKLFKELKTFVQSEMFASKKAEIAQQTFKGSQEEASLKEWQRLAKNKKLKLFYSTLESQDLNRFQEITKSETLKEYKELGNYLKNGGFSTEKKTQKAEALGKKKKYQQLKSSEPIRFYLRFQKSKAWKNYLKMENSKERNRYEELKALTSSNDFQERKAYLLDQKKWEKTDEYKKEQQYLELSKNPKIVHYEKYKENAELDFFRQWQIEFSDEFEGQQFDNSKWQPVMYNASPTLEQNYSQPGDLQAFTSGENIKTQGSSLCIEIRKEKTQGMQWQMPFGFVGKEFDYSSGCLSSCSTFTGEDKIWEAKIKYVPQKGIANTLFLAGKESQQMVLLAETGIKNRMGLISPNEKIKKEQLLNYSGLKSGQYYIFRLEWMDGTLCWKINNKKLLSIVTKLPATNLHLNASSIVVEELSSGLPACFEIDWIRIFQKKIG